MPVNYTPQFIPTNTQALQGTLDTYQKAYDTETSRQNQATDLYSAIPTTNSVDAIEKQKVMDDFTQNKLAALDKKYNYDRANSMYAQELAREISGLRNNPVWSLIQKKEEVGKIRQQIMAQRGQDYVENFNPLDVKNIDELANWSTTDVDAIRKIAATTGKALGDENKGYSVVPMKEDPMYNLYTTYKGYKDIPAAEAKLNKPEGQALLRQTIISAGGNPDNPVIWNAAREAMLSSMIGTEDTNPIQNLSAKAALDAENKQDKPWSNTDNYPKEKEYGVKSLSEYAKKTTELNDLLAIPEEKRKPEEQARINELDGIRREVQYVYNKEASKPENKKILDAGIKLIDKYGLGVDSSVLFKEYEKYFNETPSIYRKEILPSPGQYDNPTARTEYNNEDLIKSKASSIAEKLFIEKNKNRQYTPDATLQMELDSFKTKVYDSMIDFEKYYKNRSQYKSFKDSVDKTLEAGDIKVVDLFDAPLDIQGTKYKELTTGIERRLNSFDVYTNGKKDPLSQDKVRSIIKKLNAAKAVDGNVIVQAGIERDSEPELLFTMPGGEILTLRMNLARIKEDTPAELQGLMNIPGLFDGLYKDIDFKYSTYTLNDKSNTYLKTIISQRYKDTEPFSGLKLTKAKNENNEDEYVLKSDILDNIYRDDETYKNNNGLLLYGKAEIFDILDYIKDSSTGSKK